MNWIVVGCGLTGAVISRALAERGHTVAIYERRGHIGGNMHDYVDNHGFLVHQYGPHIFHTKDKRLFDYMNRFESWKTYKLVCGAVWDKKFTPTPFNFSTIDTFYPAQQGDELKKKLKRAYPDRDTATVLEVLSNPDPDIRGYAQYLFQNDYAPYTAKQWGVSPDVIDPSVLSRVPLRFSYDTGYFSDPYEALPEHSYTTFFENLLYHPNIKLSLGTDALAHLKIVGQNLAWNGELIETPVIYTGALDELFDCSEGHLPYRSLRFEWKYTKQDSYQPVPVVAYPQEKGYTRITEYKKLPPQQVSGSCYGVEYPIPYDGCSCEPYYPVLTNESKTQYERYCQKARTIHNLICCGRLADFKYYNMDEALGRALDVCKKLLD